MSLASVAAHELVKLLTTETWERAKTAVGNLWRRVHPDRAKAVESDLEEARSDLLAAWLAGDEQVKRLLISEWQGRLWRLLNANPHLAEEVQRIADGEFGPPVQSTTIGALSMKAVVSDGGSAVQAGRDVTITVGTNPDDGSVSG